MCKNKKKTIIQVSVCKVACDVEFVWSKAVCFKSGMHFHFFSKACTYVSKQTTISPSSWSEVGEESCPALPSRLVKSTQQAPTTPTGTIPDRKGDPCWSRTSGELSRLKTGFRRVCTTSIETSRLSSRMWLTRTRGRISSKLKQDNKRFRVVRWLLLFGVSNFNLHIDSYCSKTRRCFISPW